MLLLGAAPGIALPDPRVVDSDDDLDRAAGTCASRSSAAVAPPRLTRHEEVPDQSRTQEQAARRWRRRGRRFGTVLGMPSCSTRRCIGGEIFVTLDSELCALCSPKSPGGTQGPAPG
jgi:hypothetical protein